MNKFLLVLVGAIGIGIGLGVVFFIPSLKNPDTAEANQANVSTAIEDESVTSSDEETEEAELYDVIKVVDGDTIAISMNGKSETIRLIGIDTPETVDSRVEVQCFGTEASNKAKALLAGRKVSLEMDTEEGERDKYDRLLAYVYRDDGLFFNKYMIEEGYAHEYTYDDPYKYQKEFKAAEATAKAAKKGLWNPNACPATSAPAAKTTSSVNVPKQEVAPPLNAPQSGASGEQPASQAVVAPQSQQASQTQSQPTSQLESQQQQQTQQNPSSPPSPPAQSSSNYTCSSNMYNCSDFTTHDEAQSVFEMCGGVGNDVHRLDSNKDGEACESLP